MTISGKKFLSTLPEDMTAPGNIEKREQMMLSEIKKGNHLPIVWVPLTLKEGEDELILFAPTDALQIGVHLDSFRVNLTAKSCDIVAKHFQSILPTSKLVKAAWRQGFRYVTPCTQTPDSKMADTSRMARHSSEVDAKLEGVHGMVAGVVGKHWVLSNHLIDAMVEGAPMACNYGWFRVAPTSSNLDNPSMYQTEGFRHNYNHVDYSQICWFISENCFLNGRQANVRDEAVARLLVDGDEPLRFFGYDIEEEIPEEPESPEEQPEEPPGYVYTKLPLKKGSQGADVVAWQRQLIEDDYGHLLGSYQDDGYYGSMSERATLAWQTDRPSKVSRTGIVDEETVAAIGSPREELPEPELNISYVEAKYYDRNPRVHEIAWVVLHSGELRELAHSAEALGTYFGTTITRPASAHYSVDCDSIVQHVKDNHRAWHAPGGNDRGIGIEHAGYANQTREQWLDSYGVRMLTLSAKLTASLCHKYDLPVRFVDRNEVGTYAPGITTHAEITYGFKIRGGHIDPGTNFPMDWYLEKVRNELEILKRR